MESLYGEEPLKTKVLLKSFLLFQALCWKAIFRVKVKVKPRMFAPLTDSILVDITHNCMFEEGLWAD